MSLSSQSLFRGLVPDTVAVVDTRDEISDPPPKPEEFAAVKRAVLCRQTEFITGRACARAALAVLDMRTSEPLTRTDEGLPRWPPGVIGSITHCAGYRAAAVAKTADVAALGIDAEPNAALPPDVVALVAAPHEVSDLARHKQVAGHVSWDRLLFSAKEAVFKAWFPVTRVWLDFSDVELRISPNRGTFEARLRNQLSLTIDGLNLTRLSGRWTVQEDLLLTAIVCDRARR